MTAKPSVLVIEDERAIRTGICDVLAFKGYEPVGVERGDDGLDEALTGRFAVCIVDVMLPGMDGFTICSRVREALPRQALLMLTARGSEEDILRGFSVGADDYVTKPFSVAQLVARVEALLRRTVVEAAEQFAAGDVQIDGGRLSAQKHDVQVDLSPRDVEVLSALSRVPGKVVSRTELLRDVWGYARAEALETRCVDMHIAKLRRKLEPLDGGEQLIETVRGAGYRLRGT
jgi:two-component system response regulator RegX3